MGPQDIKEWLEKLDKRLGVLTAEVAGLSAGTNITNKTHGREIALLFDKHDGHEVRLRHLEYRLAIYTGAAMVVGMIVGGLFNVALGYLLKTVTS